MTPDKPPVNLGNLKGPDGNVFVVLGRCKAALREAGRGSEWLTFHAEATTGDYRHVLATVDEWFEVFRDGPPQPTTALQMIEEER